MPAKKRRAKKPAIPRIPAPTEEQLAIGHKIAALIRDGWPTVNHATVNVHIEGKIFPRVLTVIRDPRIPPAPSPTWQSMDI